MLPAAVQASHVSSGSSSEAAQPNPQQLGAGSGDGSGAVDAIDAAVGKPQRNLPQSWDEFARWYEVSQVLSVVLSCTERLSTASDCSQRYSSVAALLHLPCLSHTGRCTSTRCTL